MNVIKKKSHEEYVDEVLKINPNVEVIGKYVNSTTKIKLKCLIDGYEWDAIPSHILNGHGCPKCSKNARKSNDEYIDEVKEIHPNIIVVGNYINAQTKIKHRCAIDNYEWDVAPNTILSGCGCPMCAGNAKKTTETYKAELKEVNPDIEVMESYRGANIPIAHKCKIDGYIWNVRPAQVLSGTGCPKCAGHLKMSQEEYVSKLELENPNIEVIGEYINARTPITHRCKIHNILWDATPGSILSGTGCPECGRIKSHNSRRKTLDEYRDELLQIHPDILAIGEYNGSNIPMLHKCIIDGCEWMATPSNILRGSGCPKCNESHGERDIAHWLDAHNVQYKRQYKFSDCKDIRPLPFDFYLPEYHLCIEFDGMQHYQSVPYFGGDEAFKILVAHDKIKNDYCDNNDIQLLRIPYFKNIDDELNNFLFI